MDFLSYYIVVLLFLILVWSCFQYFRRGGGAANKQRLAPGPYPFPIIGNIHQLLGKNPHQSLAKLSKIYGPLMSLQLGRIYTVVVSSPEMAKEILQKNDQAFSGRTVTASGHAHDHHKFSVAFLPPGNLWRKLRKLSREQMLSIPRLQASEGHRQEKLQKLCDYVRERCGQEVSVGEAVFVTALNLMSATLFSTEVATFDSDAAQEFKNTFQSLMNAVGNPNLADFFPVLKPFDPQGIQRNSQFYFGILLGFIQDIINQRILMHQQSKGGFNQSDLLETLLDIRRQGSEDEFVSIQEIKHLLLELFVGGADTTQTAVEWAMTELLLNPNKLSKAKKEIRAHVKGEKKQSVEESDISRLPYLQAVIKESLRLHPPAPLLIPHKSEYDVQVSGGYTIPKGTQILVNAWAIGRDLSVWTDPDSFQPERFLDSPIDFKGQHFEFIPFGSGRRICLGMPLADRLLHIVVATLIHHFDWKLEAEAKAQAARKEELFGLALRRAVPLKAVPIKPLS